MSAAVPASIASATLTIGAEWRSITITFTPFDSVAVWKAGNCASAIAPGCGIFERSTGGDGGLRRARPRRGADGTAPALIASGIRRAASPTVRSGAIRSGGRGYGGASRTVGRRLFARALGESLNVGLNVKATA